MFILSKIIERFKRRRRLLEESRELHGFAMAIVSREHKPLGNRTPYCLDHEMPIKEEDNDK